MKLDETLAMIQTIGFKIAVSANGHVKTAPVRNSWNDWRTISEHVTV